jgi:hypothetical protein
MDTNTKLENFLKNIDIDRETMTTKVNGIEINVYIDEESKGSCYVDNDYHALTHEYRIVMTNPNRSTAVMEFDFYHECGHIMLDNKIIDTADAKEWYDEQFFKLPETMYDYLLKEMACDEYAYDKFNYRGDIKKFLPFVSKERIFADYPDADEEKVKEYINKTNEELRIRRKYLVHVANENTPFKGTSTSTGDRVFKFTGNKKAYPNTRLGKLLALADTADAMGLGADENRIHVKNNLHFAMDKMQIRYSTKDKFEDMVNKIIKALEPNGDDSLFDIPEYEFKLLIEEPDDWNQEITRKRKGKEFTRIGYQNYYYIDEGAKKYDRIPPHETAPAFEQYKYFRRIKIDIPAVIENRRRNCADYLNKFLKPNYAKYKKEFFNEKRLEYMNLIRELSFSFANNGIVPSEYDIANTNERYRGIDNAAINVKIKTNGLLSYNERKLLEAEELANQAKLVEKEMADVEGK